MIILSEDGAGFCDVVLRLMRLDLVLDLVTFVGASQEPVFATERTYSR